jgi:hypothetical protein
VDVSGRINVLGNVTSPFFVGNGSLLTGITSTLPATANIDIRGNLIGVYANVSNIIAVQGNVGNIRMVGGNVAVSGQVNVLGNVVAPVHVVDGTYNLEIVAGDPQINLDTDDYLSYYRAENQLIYYTGSVARLTVDGTGNLATTGNLFVRDGNFTGNVVVAKSIRGGNTLTLAYPDVAGNIFAIQTTSSFSGNAMLLNIPRNSSVADYAFINCTNTTGNIFNINGRGTTTVTTPVSSPALSVESTAATGAYISDVARLQTTAAGAGTFNFINCLSDAAAVSRFSVNGLGNITAAGAMAIANTATFTSAANANILTVSGTTLDNSGASLIQATTLRGNATTYSLLRLDNIGGRLLDVDGSGSMFLTSPSVSDIMTITGRTSAMLGNALTLTIPKLSLTDYNFITCRNTNGQTLGIDGRGMVTATTFVNTNVVVLNANFAGYTTDVLRMQTASNTNLYNMIHARNGAGAVFRVNGNGAVYGVGAFQTSGADYAEMFEWEDGNKLDEDRRGMTVVLGNNGIIRIVNQMDNPIDVIGVVSVNPSVVGDTRWNEWSGRFLKDKFGVKLSNTVYYISNVSNENERVRCGINDTPPSGYEKITSSEHILNPKYNPADTYVPREDRLEWSPIGLVGKLRVLPGQIVNPGWKLLRTYKHPDGDTLEYLVK